MERNSFVFYKDWKEAIKDLPDDVRLEIYDSIIEYATTGNIQGLKSMAKIAFNFIKNDIDRDTKKYMSIVESNKQNGSKGGAPKGNSNARKKTTENNPNNPTVEKTTENNPNNLDNDNDNDSVDDKVKEKEKEKENTPLPPKGEGARGEWRKKRKPGGLYLLNRRK